jgi:hypothetical protein
MAALREGWLEGAWRTKPRVSLAGAVAALCLAACTAVDEGKLTESGAIVTAPAKKEMTAEDFLKKSTYCPPVQIRAGTGTMTVYERGHEGEASHVRYLASITQTARECLVEGGALVIKVGVAGRVLAGPKGSAASITLPLRIAVAKQLGGAGPLYSQLFKIPVSLAAPTYGANYNQVFDRVIVTAGPQDRDLIIYVGFDEGPSG